MGLPTSLVSHHVFWLPAFASFKVGTSSLALAWLWMALSWPWASFDFYERSSARACKHGRIFDACVPIVLELRSIEPSLKLYCSSHSHKCRLVLALYPSCFDLKLALSFSNRLRWLCQGLWMHSDGIILLSRDKRTCMLYVLVHFAFSLPVYEHMYSVLFTNVCFVLFVLFLSKLSLRLGPRMHVNASTLFLIPCSIFVQSTMFCVSVYDIWNVYSYSSCSSNYN